MKKRLLSVGGVAVLVIGLFAAGGCNRITGSSVRRNMSPEKLSIARNSQQRKNDIARTIDTNTRQIWDDFDYILLLDRPRRLSSYPIP